MCIYMHAYTHMHAGSNPRCVSQARACNSCNRASAVTSESMQQLQQSKCGHTREHATAATERVTKRVITRTPSPATESQVTVSESCDLALCCSRVTSQASYHKHTITSDLGIADERAVTWLSVAVACMLCCSSGVEAGV